MFKTGTEHYNLFWQLREQFRIEREKFYILTQKSHSCLHSCYRSNEMNPRLTWCFKFEDYMGHMRKLASSCKNAYGVDVSKNMLEKWWYGKEWLLTYNYVM